MILFYPHTIPIRLPEKFFSNWSQGSCRTAWQADQPFRLVPGKTWPYAAEAVQLTG